MIKIAIVYDTSFLMSKEKRIFDAFPRERRNYLSVHHYIPQEVQLELSKHLANTEDQTRIRLAREARALYAKMIPLPNFTTISLDHIAIPDIHETTLGPDSSTDKKLLGYAYNLLNEQTANIVYVATRDAGIGAEIAYQATQCGIRVYCDIIHKLFLASVLELTEPLHVIESERIEQEKAQEKAEKIKRTEQEEADKIKRTEQEETAKEEEALRQRKNLWKKKKGNITFNCPHCSKKLKAKFEMAGNPSVCENCGNAIDVPNEPSMEDIQQVEKRSETLVSVWYGVVIGLIGGAFLLWKTKDD